MPSGVVVMSYGMTQAQAPRGELYVVAQTRDGLQWGDCTIGDARSFLTGTECIGIARAEGVTDSMHAAFTVEGTVDGQPFAGQVNVEVKDNGSGAGYVVSGPAGKVYDMPLSPYMPGSGGHVGSYNVPG